MRRAVSVNVFLYRVKGEQIEYLILKRVACQDLKLSGFWQGVSGALEPRENFETAARREVFEETGLLLEQLTATGLTLNYPIKSEWRSVYGSEPDEIIEHVFFSRINAQPVLSEEHSAFAWLSYQEAYQRLTFGDYRLAIESVKRLLDV